jgi:ABC-2 type transport system permease protein
MSLKRTWAVFMRYFYVAAKLDHLSDLLYWPAIDIFLWGMTTVWIQHQDQALPDIALVLLTGLIFWQIVWRGNYEVGVNLLLEFWNRNLVNLFATPLKLFEWVIGIMLMGVFKIVISVLFGSLLVYLLYTLNVFTVGWAFLPFTGLLLMAGWIFGFLAAGIVVYWGQRVQMLAWMTAYIFAPFSAVFYPVSALPSWAQSISWCLPTTYIFEGMREVLLHHTFSLNYFLISLGLSVVYLTLSFAFFKFMFEKSREKGLARLE